MTLESLWNTRKLTDEPYNWLTKTAAPTWVLHLARHSYEYAVLEKASVEEDIEAFAAFIAQLVMIA
jgi:hypothetical protein